MVYADTLFGTGKERETTADNASYGDLKSQAHDFTSAMLETMFEIMPDHATIWLHCNQDSDYIYRAEMNRIFGKNNFLCQIAWCYASGGRSTKAPAMKHDTIFWYKRNSKTDHVYNIVREPYRSLKPGETRKGFHKDGKPITSFWTDIGIISTTGKERVDYPTQKPLKLLNRINEISTNPGDVMVDPCCGSGTSVISAHNMGREGHGIDINPDAISKASKRLI